MMLSPKYEIACLLFLFHVDFIPGKPPAAGRTTAGRTEGNQPGETSVAAEWPLLLAAQDQDGVGR